MGFSCASISLSHPRAAVAAVPSVARAPDNAVANITAEDAIAVGGAPPTFPTFIDQHGHSPDAGTGRNGKESEQRQPDTVALDPHYRPANHARQNIAVDPSDIEGQHHWLVPDDFGALEGSRRRRVGDRVRRGGDQTGWAVGRLD